MSLDTAQTDTELSLLLLIRDGRYPKNSFGRLVGRLVEPLFVVQLVVQLVGY